MPGPPPKPPGLRQRRNRVTTRATLQVAEAPITGTPELPARGRKRWHPLTVAWWEDVWASPMAPEFLRADIHGLYLLADLVDAYWRATDPRIKRQLAGEIRQQGQRFGLSPIDRRRLQWEGMRVEEAEEKRTPQQRAPGKRSGAADPREALRVIS